MKKIHKIIAASLLVSAATAGSGVVLAGSDVTANVAMSSNYIFRGVTQTNDISAVSGGVDYEHKSGGYVGVWQSSLSSAGNNYEQDIYGGYKFKTGPVDLDVGYIKYMYPVTAGSNVDEVYVNASFDKFSGGLALNIAKDGGVKTGDMYLYVGATFEVKKKLNLDVTIGNYNYASGTGTDYTHFRLALSKGDFSIAYDKNNLSGTAGNGRLSVSWSQGFDL